MGGCPRHNCKLRWHPSITLHTSSVTSISSITIEAVFVEDISGLVFPPDGFRNDSEAVHSVSRTVIDSHTIRFTGDIGSQMGQSGDNYAWEQGPPDTAILPATGVIT